MLPSWLDKKPKKFVKHLYEKIQIAQQIPAEHIRKHSATLYIVQSNNSIDSEYEVFLGDDNYLPSCQCLDWKKHLMPCKHMMAIFEHHSEVTWDSFCTSFKDSPFFKVDMEVVGVIADNESQIGKSDDLEKKENEYDVNDLECKSFELPEPKHLKLSKTSACRELLNSIKSLTYIVSDPDAFDCLENQLRVAFHGFSEKCKKDHGLIVETTKKTKSDNAKFTCEIYQYAKNIRISLDVLVQQ